VTLGSESDRIDHDSRQALGANLGSTVLFTLLLLSPFLWGAAVWHWLLAVAFSVVLGIYFYIRREWFEEPGPDADETRFPR
jgi:cell division protein FtsW (lipid II flippase)